MKKRSLDCIFYLLCKSSDQKSVTDTQRAYLLLHISVILWGFTAILGALISLSAFELVWHRVLITSFFLLLWPGIVESILKLGKKQFLKLSLIGVVIAIHWLCFYGSIKLANASIALITMSTTALFTAFLEPLLLRKKISHIEIIIGCLVIPAMILVTQGFEESKMLGFWAGIMAAFLAALFAVLNKQVVEDTRPEVITLIEMFAATVFLTLMLPIFFHYNSDFSFVPKQRDIILIISLSLFCTILPFVLHLKALRHITAFATNLAINLEPVYGIVMAILILNENRELAPTFYLGVLIIFVLIFLYPLINFRSNDLKSIND